MDWSPEDKRRSVAREGEATSPRAAMADYRNMDNENEPDRHYRDTDKPARCLRLRDRESPLARAETSMTRRECE